MSNMDIVILIATCVFAFLIGGRIRQRIKAKQQLGGTHKGSGGNKNSKKSKNDEAQNEMQRYEDEKQKNKERRIRLFSYIQFIVLGVLIVYMIPTLIRDTAFYDDNTDTTNLALRYLIFVFAIYVEVVTFLKIFRGNKKK